VIKEPPIERSRNYFRGGRDLLWQNSRTLGWKDTLGLLAIISNAPDLKNSIKKVGKYFLNKLIKKLFLIVGFSSPKLEMGFSNIRNRKSRRVLAVPIAFFTFRDSGATSYLWCKMVSPLAL
jgi:hypothetical protein